MFRTPRLSFLHLLLAAALALSVSLPPSTLGSNHLPWGEPGIIQPGAKPDIGGTLAFLFQARDESAPDGTPALYISSHGHGTLGEVGDVVHLVNGPEVGVVVARENNGHDDWRLIRISDESRAFVNFEVRHWTGPTGTPHPGTIGLDDVVCMYGWGNVAQMSPELRPRCGRLTSAYTADSGVTVFQFFPYLLDPGSSGSPIIHHSAGLAMGILVAANPVSQEAIAIDVCSLLARFASHGWNLELATADYHPPEPLPVPPAPYVHPSLQGGPPGWWQFDSPCLS